MLSCAVQAVARRGAGWLAGETRGVVGSELNGGRAVWQPCASIICGRPGVRVQLASSGVRKELSQVGTWIQIVC